MDATEKSLLLKIIDAMSVADNSDNNNTEEEEFDFIKNPKEHLEKLKIRNASLKQSSNLNEGDIVVWKEGLKNKRLPEYGQPAIIITKLNPIKIADEGNYSESLDIKLGFINEDDEFFAFNYDSRRFEVLKS